MRKLTIYSLLISIGYILWPNTATANLPLARFSLDEMIVTASRLPQPLMAANANVSVISRQDIETNHYRTITEALAQVSSVSVRSYGNGVGYANVNSVLINGSDQYVVLIDGVRVNTSSSTLNVFSFDSIKTLDNIDRIEVLKGSASALYGADAKGGVINIITDQKPQVETNIQVSGGSFSYQDYQLYHAGANKTWRWQIGLSRRHSGDYTDGHGHRYQSHEEADTVQIQISKKLNATDQLSFSFNDYNSDTIHTGTLYRANNNLRPPAKAAEHQQQLALTYQQEFNENSKNQLTFYRNSSSFNGDNYYYSQASRFSGSSSDPDFAAATPDYSSYNYCIAETSTLGFSDQYTNIWHPKNTLVGGLEYYEDHIDHWRDGYDKYVNSYRDKTIRTHAAYLQNNWQFDDRWLLTLGLRYDNNSYAGSHLSPSLTLGLTANAKTNLYLSTNEYFIAPSHYKLFSSSGNPNLKPEYGQTYSLGINHQFDEKTKLNSNIFYRQGKDVFGFNGTEQKYYNINEEEVYGLELSLHKKFDEFYSGQIGYNWLRSNSTNYKGVTNTSNAFPRGEFKGSLNYRKAKWFGSLNLHGIIGLTGQTKNSAGWGLYPVANYLLVDLAANYQANKNILVYLKANNLLDSFYTTSPCGIYGEEDYYSGPGRSFIVGIKYIF